MIHSTILFAGIAFTYFKGHFKLNNDNKDSLKNGKSSVVIEVIKSGLAT